MPYTPKESLRTLRHMYDEYGDFVFDVAGFRDAFNLGEFWVANGYLAIDQGTIVPMIENYRTGLCWRLFMSNPEIRPMLNAIPMLYEIDFDFDGDIELDDAAVFFDCTVGADINTVPPGCTTLQFADSDLDNDGDVDAHDFAIVQQICTGP